RVGHPIETDAALQLLVVEVWQKVGNFAGAERLQKAGVKEAIAPIAAVLENHLAHFGQVHGVEMVSRAEVELSHRLAERPLHVLVKHSPNRLTGDELQCFAGQVEAIAVILITSAGASEYQIL